MISRNQSFKINLSWLAALSGGLLVSLTTISLAGGPPPQGKPVAQPNSTPEVPQAAPQTTPQAAPQTTPQAVPQTTPQAAPQTTTLLKFPFPSAKVAPSNGTLTIRLVNNTNLPINYQIVGYAAEKTLEKGATIEINKLTTPLNITYQRPDGGFLIAMPKATDPKILDVTFSLTNDLSADTKSMNIQADGLVFLN
jgi:hypothetical protein